MMKRILIPDDLEADTVSLQTARLKAIIEILRACRTEKNIITSKAGGSNVKEPEVPEIRADDLIVHFFVQ